MILSFFFFFQAEDGIRDAQESRGLGDVLRDRTTGVSTSKSQMPGKQEVPEPNEHEIS